MKEFHIINVGTTIITNYKKSPFSPEEIKNAKISDNELWVSFLDEPRRMYELYDFVKNEPKKNSAELNSFLRMIENSKSQRVEVYFTGTKTPVNEICVRILERFMKENGFTVYITREFPGYFLRIYEDEDRAKSFVEGISDMLDHLIILVLKKRAEGYRVYFNPTGGFKAHVITSALVGFMSFCEVYYIHEEFDDVIVFPPLFYIPKNKERELLEILKKKSMEDDIKYEMLENKYSKEIERLEHYGLIVRELDRSTGKFSRINITNRGILYLELTKEEGYV